MKYLYFTYAIMFSFITCCAIASDTKFEGQKELEIFLQKKNNTTATEFYMWIVDENVIVENMSRDIIVGYDFGGNGIYLTCEDIGNAMLYVHPYNNKKNNSNTVIKFGGQRENDIHIYLPKDIKLNLKFSSIKPINPTN